MRTETLDELAAAVDRRVQTAVAFGWSTQELRDFMADSRLGGIDRIVPVGEALAFGRYWDGFDLFRTLTRSVSITAAPVDLATAPRNTAA